MKKLLIFVSTVLLFSCSSDDGANSTTNSSIVGKWNLTQILESGNAISDYSCNPTFDITEFKENGNSTAKYADFDDNNNCVQFTDVNTYTLNGDVLTEIYNGTFGYIYKYKVIELTSTTLKLEQISDSNLNGDVVYSYELGESVKVFTKIN